VDPQGISRTTTIGRADTGSMHTVTPPDGIARTLTWDDAGNLTGMSDSTGYNFNLAYDANNRIAAMTDGFGRGMAFTWNHQQLDSVTPPTGQTRTFQYDRAGRKIAETDWMGNTRSFAYDALGRVTRSRTSLAG